jgi:cytochrome c oxidase subunit II
MPTFLAQIGQRFWMPDPASSSASGTDFLFYLIFWISAAMTLLVVALMIFCILRYRKRPGHKAQRSPSHSTALELTWTVIPTVTLLVIFYYGFRGYVDLATPPDYAYEVYVTAYKWGWSFTYPNGAESDQLVVPRDRPVRLVLSSEDVIHSLFIPAFRVKKDVVPHRYNQTWFQATQVGEYDLFCAEYCGTLHSEMATKVVVVEPAAFAQWVQEQAEWITTVPPVQAGARLFASKGCAQCHSADGTGGIGPTLQNLFGHEVPLADGSRVLADENYIRESILNPGAKIHAGYDNVMPSYQGRITDLEIRAMIEWMKSISDKGPPPLEMFEPDDVQSDVEPQGLEQDQTEQETVLRP